ncbi:hypothetical protein D3C73_1413880 [compost metagenome]
MGLGLDIATEVAGNLATDVEVVVVPDHVRTAFYRGETFNFHRALQVNASGAAVQTAVRGLAKTMLAVHLS